MPKVPKRWLVASAPKPPSRGHRWGPRLYTLQPQNQYWWRICEKCGAQDDTPDGAALCRFYTR
jgi:hypothetical protein